MDYSSGLPDPAAEASPWASSPQQSRNSIERSSEEPPALNPALPQPISGGSQSGDMFATDSQPSDRPFEQDPTSNSYVGGVHESFNAATAETHRKRNHGDTRFEDEGQHQSQDRPPSQHQRQAPQPQQRYHQQHQRPRAAPEPQYKLQGKITGLERPGRKDLIVRFDVYTNLPGFRTTQFRDVRRAHSEFAKLAEHLIASTPEVLVPALPPSSTPAGAGTEEDENRVKTSIQRWMNVVFGNRLLMRDPEILRFVESDPGYSPVMRMSQPATGARRKYLKQFAPPPDDTPELRDARPVVKSFYLSTMDAGQKVEKMVRGKKGLGLAESEFGARIQQMSDQELHPGLKNAYRKLGKTLQTIGDLHAVQAIGEATTLEDPLNYHSSDAYIVKETLTNRHILLRELLQAQTTTRAKISATERLRSSSSVRRDKVDEAIQSLEEAKAHEHHLEDKTRKVTNNLVYERRSWFARTASDLRASIREYVIREIEVERRALAVFESVRPDVRAIDASGGLSRLGREGTPASRRSALTNSQGPRGDAWSGIQRRSDGLNRSVSGTLAPAGQSSDEASADAEASNGRQRALSTADSMGSIVEDDDDRVDARNAASRLAQSTF